MTRNEGPLTEKQWQQVRNVYSEGEVVELMAAIGLFNYFNRFNNLLDMEPTGPAS
jgi:alkylhydroperoxidase family enzyme